MPVVTPAATPAPVAPAKPPEIEDLVEKLPAQDFLPKLAMGAPADKQRSATALNTAGLALYGKKDYAGAEAKYVLALAADPGHTLARYNLACIYALTNRVEKGLALLVELRSAKDCESCVRAADLARSDDDWQAQWDKPVFWQVLEHDGDVDVGAKDPDDDDEATDGDGTPVVKCPAGTTKHKQGRTIVFCAKGGTKHGPYSRYEEGYELSEGVDQERGAYKNGKKHGLWYADATFQGGSEGPYVAGVKHGVWTEWHREERTTTAFVRGKPHGYSQTQRSLESGGTMISAEQRYVDGVAHGEQREWNAEPYYLRRTGTMEHGKPAGTWIEYDGPNRISKQETYTAGKLHGEAVMYHEGDKRTVAHYDHGVRHGAFEWWNAGKLVGKTTLDHGTGDWVEFEGERLVARGKLVKDVRDGAWALDDRDHRGWSEGAFAMGKRTGRWTNWTDDTKAVKRWEGAYKNDERDGAWAFWRDDGTKLGKGNYVMGKVDGAWVIYDKAGTAVEQELVFRKNKVLKVDGERATEGHQAAFDEASRFVTEPTELVDREGGDEGWR